MVFNSFKSLLPNRWDPIAYFALLWWAVLAALVIMAVLFLPTKVLVGILLFAFLAQVSRGR